MPRNFKSAVLIAGFSVGSIFIWAFFVYPASAKQGFTIYPAKISLTVDKGKEQTISIKLTNAGDDTVGVITTLEDMVPTSGASGYDYLPKAEGITSLVDWITVNKKQFNLKPGASKDVPVTIKVPEDASPGSRFAIIFFATGSPSAGQLNVSARVGSLVFLTVPGDFRQTGEILNFNAPQTIWDKKPINFKFDFQNTGTVYFEPKGAITITDVFGKKTAEIPVSGQVILPTGLRTIEASWPNPGWLLGIYKARLAISVTGKGDIAAKEVTFYALPLYPGLGASGLLIILIAAVWYIKRNFKFQIARVDGKQRRKKGK